MSAYCDIAPGHPWHGPYHENDYGFPVHDDNVLFERFVLEINQAGLSWLTILKKREGFSRAYDGFDITRVAAYGEADRQRLLLDAGIIRNRLKIDAAIANAGRILQLQEQWGSFAAWLDAHHPRDAQQWQALFKRTFRSTGGQIVSEFLLSTGYLPDAHRMDCPVQSRIIAAGPPWRRSVSPSQ